MVKPIKLLKLGYKLDKFEGKSIYLIEKNGKDLGMIGFLFLLLFSLTDLVYFVEVYDVKKRYSFYDRRF